MSEMLPQPPAVGAIVRVRSRQYLVEDRVDAPDPTSATLVRMSCLDDDAQGDALEVLWEHEIDAEVVDVRSLRPLDVDTLASSVRKTGRAVIVELGWPVAGYGAEIAYQLQRHCLDQLDAPIERVTSDDVPMPYAKNLEYAYLPNKEKIAAAVRKTLA